MAEVESLPKFKRPPVGEVSIGVRFRAKGFLATHFGLFHQRISKKFPLVESLHFLPPEMFMPPNQSTEQSRLFQQDFITKLFVAGIPQTRIAFKSSDEVTLIQLQGDRLYFNWRSDSESYPHFSYVQEGFVAAYQEFVSFVSDNGFGPVEPVLCEVLYVNPLPTRLEAADLSRPDEVFRIINNPNLEDWPIPLHDLSFNARYRLSGLNDEFLGWLTANMSSGHVLGNVPKISLQMMARGVPIGEDLEGITAFHNIGHAAIVRNFAAITSNKMHALWERIYE